MFRSLLVANRGEIACRVIRTARRMGLRTVAVFSEADRDALHVALADEAWPIGPAPARDSYLSIERVLDAARRSGAEAIHPGYGFLSENARFAAACAAAGIVFVGPPAAAIEAMGDKAAAKALMERTGVPLVPGYHGPDQDPAHLAAEAQRIGFPVLIKASAGGGGKGMRVVEAAADFADGLALAKGEALSSFGDDRVLIERYLAQPRHIEIQIFADRHGNVVSLFERDCSIQRRHQKVLEEAPAPGMDEARRRAMGDAACEAARAIGYEGAGTIEFIVENDSFCFMEMNTRLQVEHPVTEMVTGQNLVEWQLRVAAGEPLPLMQDDLGLMGHAIEVRISAEDPARGFLPSTGRLLHLHVPPESAEVRVDTGVREGDAITPYYDPMIAKLIVWGEDRERAIAQLRRALAEYEVAGVQTNLGLLRAIAGHEAFAAGDLDTGFIARHEADLLPHETAVPPVVLAAASLHALAASVAPADPWDLATAWRLNGEGFQDLHWQIGDETHAVRAYPRAGGMRVVSPGGTLDLMPGDGARLIVDGVQRRAPVVRNGDAFIVVLDGESWTLRRLDPLAPPETAGAGGDRLVAPMPGRILSVHTEPGAAIGRGDVLVVLEAMKVQMRLAAPRDGVVERVAAEPGALVEDGAELVSFVRG